MMAHATRRSTAAAPFLPEFSTDFSNVVANDVHYYVFSSDLENPHGAVHVTIGGNMVSVPTSALDPCFWLHHTNIDRLWEQWLRICGRSNPSDTTYLKQSFTFFDETGAAVVMTGSQILNTATQLNYQYDFHHESKTLQGSSALVESGNGNRIT